MARKIKNIKGILIVLVALIFIAALFYFLSYKPLSPFRLNKTTYKTFHFNELSLEYPNWPSLNIEILNRFINNSLPPELSNKARILVGVTDNEGAVVLIIRRELLKKEEGLPFGNLIKEVIEEETKSFTNIGALQDFKILKETYSDREIEIEWQGIDGRGVGYKGINHTYLLTTNFLGFQNKYLYTLSFSAPLDRFNFYEKIVNHLFNR
jgi:hypothetical protein